VDAEAIYRHWARQADEHGAGHRASWADRHAIELEVSAIGKRLTPGQRVLDVGCANGFSSFSYVRDRGVDLTGVDFVPAMVEAAEHAALDLPEELRSRVRFGVADVRELPFEDGSFDVVIATRVIINLPERSEQARGLAECARVLAREGTLLLSEATLSGWNRLNALRGEWGLPPVPMPEFNNYLDEDEVVRAVAASLKLVEISDFASSYFVATRLVKPLLAAVAPATVDVADPEAEFNRWAAQLPAAGDYGTQKLFVFRKR
jgi:ubiquinone/menaquinone biosynthesis C-methylase UbiE